MQERMAFAICLKIAARKKASLGKKRMFILQRVNFLPEGLNCFKSLPTWDGKDLAI